MNALDPILYLTLRLVLTSDPARFVSLLPPVEFGTRVWLLPPIEPPRLIEPDQDSELAPLPHVLLLLSPNTAMAEGGWRRQHQTAVTTD